MFIHAKEIWAEKESGKYNQFCGFSVEFDYNGGKLSLRCAGADYYKIYLNGVFIHYGPARTAKGWFRCDEIDLSGRAADGLNRLFVLAAYYGVNSFQQVLNNKPFFAGELYLNGECIKYTGRDFAGHSVPWRKQAVQRYSFQRNFVEILDLDEGYQDLLNGCAKPGLTLKCREPIKERFIGRRSKPSLYGRLNGAPIYYGDMLISEIPQRAVGQNPPYFLIPGPVFKCFKPSAVEADTANILNHLTTISFSEGVFSKVLTDGKFCIFDIGRNAAGFLGCEIIAEEDSEVFLLFDETLSNGDVDPTRLSCLNTIQYNLKKGAYNIESYEAYTFRYVKVFCKHGRIKAESIYLTEECNRDCSYESGAKGELGAVIEAGINNFKYNATDIFMDCPSRERAGWLCDSYFTGFAEHIITGSNNIEHDFLENFTLSGRYDGLPKGMLPMCFPAEHPDGTFIPNWAMWYVLELEQYIIRTGDEAMRLSSQRNVNNILEYFLQYENEYSFLENLPGWVFVEWSRAAEFTKDVNFPTNMLYSGMLAAAGRLYGKKQLLSKAEELRKRIFDFAYNGSYFVDNAVRLEGSLTLTQNITEVCQYYAVFFGVTGTELLPSFVDKLVSGFGPAKSAPNVHKANAFIGNLLRLDILRRYRPEECVKELTGYFYDMAEQTGTLWENDAKSSSSSLIASLCHGFASYVVFIYHDLKTRGLL